MWERALPANDQQMLRGQARSHPSPLPPKPAPTDSPAL